MATGPELRISPVRARAEPRTRTRVLALGPSPFRSGVRSLARAGVARCVARRRGAEATRRNKTQEFEVSHLLPCIPMATAVHASCARPQSHLDLSTPARRLDTPTRICAWRLVCAPRHGTRNTRRKRTTPPLTPPQPPPLPIQIGRQKFQHALPARSTMGDPNLLLSIGQRHPGRNATSDRTVASAGCSVEPRKGTFTLVAALLSGLRST